MSYSDRDKEIITNALTRRELIDAAKQAIKEVIEENVHKLGWLSIKTLATAVVGALILFAISWSK